MNIWPVVFGILYRLVMGFIGKDEARDLLLQRPVGTFLLRFSDGLLGGISVAYVIMDQGMHFFLDR